MSLISIAMTTFNGEKYLKEQVKSLQNQTYKNLEIIICDDCSSDGTIEIIEEFIKNDNKIKFYKNEDNLGLQRNFLNAISKCRGELIALCDQDDIWEDNKIELLSKNIGNSMLIFHDDKLIDQDSKIIYPSFYKERGILTNNLEFKNLLFECWIPGHGMMFRKELIPYIMRLNSDIITYDRFISLIAAKVGKIKFLDKQLVRWRQHLNNNSGNKVVDKHYNRNIIDYILRPQSIDKYKRYNLDKILLIQYLLSIKIFENDDYLQEVINYYSLNDRLKAFKFAFNNIGNILASDINNFRVVKYILITLFYPKVIVKETDVQI